MDYEALFDRIEEMIGKGVEICIRRIDAQVQVKVRDANNQGTLYRKFSRTAFDALVAAAGREEPQ